MMLLSKGKENPKNQKGSRFMKTLKVSIIAMVLTLTIIISCALAMPAQAERTEKEKFLAVVIELEFDSNTVTIVSQNGQIWEIEDPSHYCFGDILIITVDTKGTPQYGDDEIKKIRKRGHMTEDAVVIWLS